jgi:hypothetical protein
MAMKTRKKRGREDGGHRFDKRHCEEDGQANVLDERVPVQPIQLDPSKTNAGYLLVSQVSLSDMRSKRGFPAIDEAKEDPIEYRLRHQFEGRRQRRQDGDQHVEGELDHALLCYGVKHQLRSLTLSPHRGAQLLESVSKPCWTGS